MVRGNATRRNGRTIVAVIASIALLGGLTLTVWLARFVHAQRIPFDTDEADHALPALDLVTAIQHRDLGGFAHTLAAQSFYPPVHSLFSAASMLLLGPTHAAARLPSVLFFFAAALVVAAAAQRETRTRPGNLEWLPLAAATIAFVLAITCLEAIDNAVLCMLEPLGTAWCALLLLLAVGEERAAPRRRIAGPPHPEPPWASLALLTIAIALTKYSFGFMTIPAVGCAILLQPRAGDRRTAIRPALWFGACVVTALAVWLLITDPYSAYRFVTGHQSSGPVLGRANLLFDVSAWFRSYFVSPLLAVAVLPLIAAAIASAWSRLSIRVAALLLVFAALMALLSTTNETRHALFALPAVWYLSAVGGAVLLERLADRAGGRGRDGAGLWISLALFVLVVGVLANQRLSHLDQRLVRELEGRPEFADLQQAIVTSVDATKPILGTGFTDRFGAQALRFALARAARLPSAAIELDVFPYREDGFQRSRDRHRHIDHPFLDPTFPRAPLSAVLERRYYRYAVQVQNPRDLADGSQPAQEFARTLERFPATAQSADGWRVVIWDLTPRDAGAGSR